MTPTPKALKPAKVLLAKNSPFIKELYKLFATNKVLTDDKPVKVKEAFATQFSNIPTTTFRNGFNKAKQMFLDKKPPPDIGEYICAYINSIAHILHSFRLTSGPCKQPVPDKNHDIPQV